MNRCASQTSKKVPLPTPWAILHEIIRVTQADRGKPSEMDTFGKGPLRANTVSIRPMRNLRKDPNLRRRPSISDRSSPSTAACIVPHSSFLAVLRLAESMFNLGLVLGLLSLVWEGEKHNWTLNDGDSRLSCGQHRRDGELGSTMWYERRRVKLGGKDLFSQRPRPLPQRSKPHSPCGSSSQVRPCRTMPKQSRSTFDRSSTLPTVVPKFPAIKSPRRGTHSLMWRSM